MHNIFCYWIDCIFIDMLRVYRTGISFIQFDIDKIIDSRKCKLFCKRSRRRPTYILKFVKFIKKIIIQNYYAALPR